MTMTIGPSVSPSPAGSMRAPSATAAPPAPSATSNVSRAASASTPASSEPELRIYAPRRPFREVLRETRGEAPAARPSSTAAARTTPAARADAASSPATATPSPDATAPNAEPLRAAAVTLLRDVARGERFVRSVMRRAARGADFSPQELLAIQAGVYRYTQELELVSKIVDKGTAAVRQTLQSQS